MAPVSSLPGACTRITQSSPAVVGLNGARRSTHVKCSLRGYRYSPCSMRYPVVCSAAAAVAVNTSDIDLFEETVDGFVSVEQPGSIPDSHPGIKAHDHTMGILSDLEELNRSLGSAISETESVIEGSQWPGLTLPPDIQKVFKDQYRKTRKEEERQTKEEARQRKDARKLRSDMRFAGQATVAAAPAGAGMSTAQPAVPAAAPQLDGAAERRARRALQRQQRGTGAGTAVEQPAVQEPAVQQPSRQQPLQQQQPAERQRRRTSSILAAATATPAGLQGSSSSRRQLETEPPTANRGGPAGPQPAAVDNPTQTFVAPTPTVAAASAAATGMPESSSSSSPSSSRRSSAAGLGFAPLMLEQRSVAAPVRAAPSRRMARAAGMRPRGRTITAAAAAALPVAPNPGAGKLVDNNVHGLDMRVELLSAEQEKELAVMVQDLLHLEGIAKELALALGRPPNDVEWMEAAGFAAAEDEGDLQGAVQSFQSRLQHGRAAKQVMISANYKLVVSICRKYQGYGMAMGDLINEGIAGLVKGVERFEPTKGCKFSTYAHWWIRQSITRSLSSQGRLVRLPSHLQEMLTKMTKVSRRYEGQYGREPSLAELASELGVDPAKIQDAYEAVLTPRSLDQPVGDGEGATLGDIVEDERMLGPEDSAYIESLKHDLEGVLTNLPAREAGVLRMRFGLLDGTEHTLDDIGAQYNVTRERIRQIEAKAIRQLRARQLQPGSVIADYQAGGMDSKQLAMRTSSGTKKQS